MAIASQVVTARYTANGATTTFTIPHVIIEADSSEVKVYLVDESGLPDTYTETLQVEGALQDYTLTGASPPGTPFDTTVTFNSAPASGLIVFIERTITYTQDLTMDLNDDVPVDEIEVKLDRLTAMIQHVNRKVSRALKTRISAPDANLDPILPEPDSQKLIRWRTDETGFENVDINDLIDAAALIAAAGGTAGILALPTDGVYGDVEAIAGVASGDRVEDAFDKVEAILEKLAPAKPPNCSAITLVITGSYSAYASNGGTPTLHATCTTDTTPLIHHGITSADGFYNGEAGVLTAKMDSVTVGGPITLTTSDDTQTSGQLEIYDDYDFYFGIFGQADFWYALIARIQSAALSVAGHTVDLIHSLTGTTSLTFYVDDPIAPSISGNSVTGSGVGRTVSGIPCLTTGDTITADFTVDDAVQTHYNATRVARATSSVTNTVDKALPVTAYNPADSVVASLALTVAANKFSANASISCIGYASDGTSTTQATTNNIRVDSISVETTRKKSGAGQYPTIGSGATQFGDAFDSTALLTAANNEELQLENAIYKYPSATDYSSNTPTAGPDYTGIAAGSYANMRWATFNLGAVSAVTSYTFTIAGQVNFGSSVLISGISLYVKVDGATPTAGWIDANAAYPGVGSPTNNGDAALVVGSSTVSSRYVTFGSTARTGNLWVRIGIPSGSTKTFTGIS